MSQRTNVMVVFGGVSSEHGVSCLTAANVVASMDHERFNPIAVGITPSGRWVRVSDERVRALATEGSQLPSVPEDGDEAVIYQTGNQVMLATRADGRFCQAVHLDVAFALLHGPFGEDGTIQGMFEIWGLPYVGAGVTASAVGMDKIVMKQVLASVGLPTAEFVAIHHEWDSDRRACLDAAGRLRFPVFVKPARAGSSIGITRVTDPAALEAAIEMARRHDPRVLVEEGVVGREVECAVLGGRGNRPPRTSGPGEIVMLTDDRFYDFEAKYLPAKQVRLDIPAQLDDATTRAVQDVAARTFQAVGCEGLARVDTFVTGDGEVLVNEINTMPGFTQYSMFPMLWQEAGMTYSELITDLIELALERPVGLR